MAALRRLCSLNAVFSHSCKARSISSYTAHVPEGNELLRQLQIGAGVHILHGAKAIGKSTVAKAIAASWEAERGQQVLLLDFSKANENTLAQRILKGLNDLELRSRAMVVEQTALDAAGIVGLEVSVTEGSSAKCEVSEKLTLHPAPSEHDRQFSSVMEIVENKLVPCLSTIWGGAVGLVVIDEAQAVSKLGPKWGAWLADALSRIAAREGKVAMLLVTSDYDALRRVKRLAREVSRVHALGEQSKAFAALHWAAVQEHANDEATVRQNVAAAAARSESAVLPLPPPRRELDFEDVWAVCGGHPRDLEDLGRKLASLSADARTPSVSELLQQHVLQEPYARIADAALAPSAPPSALATTKVLSVMLQHRRGGCGTGCVAVGDPDFRGLDVKAAMLDLVEQQCVTFLQDHPLKPGPEGHRYESGVPPLIQFSTSREAAACEAAFASAHKRAEQRADDEAQAAKLRAVEFLRRG